jgi:lysyl-tRNA synthetase class II
MLYRSHGKLAFARLMDSTAQIQLMFHRDNCQIDIAKSQNEAELLISIPLTKGEEGGSNSLKNKNINPLNLPHEGGENLEMSAYKFMEKMVDV